MERPAVVVTGGSSGIGASFCHLAARSGWHVWIGYANGVQRAMRIAQTLAEQGCSASIVALPLNDGQKIRTEVARMAASARRPSAVVLCGGPPPDVTSYLKITADQLHRQLDCTVVGNHVLLTELWRCCFRRRGGGRILAVLSAAQAPPVAPYMASYVTAKGALETLLHSIAAELGRSGLRIGVVRPGYVETPMLSAFDSRFLESARDTALDQRFLKPEDVANALLRGLENTAMPTGSIMELPIDVAQAA